MSTLFGKKTLGKRQRFLANGERKQDDFSNSASGVPKIGVHDDEQQPQQQQQQDIQLSPWAGFDELGLAEPLVETCKALGFQRPSPVQRTIIPFLLREDSSHVLALAETGSGKTAAFVLPLLHRLSVDPYGIFAVIVSPTRELAKQIHQQVLALGSSYNVESTLVVGGMDMVKQSCALDRKPHFVVATPGRLAELLRGPSPPNLKHVRFLVLDEADRLLAANSGFERDVAELLLHCNRAKRTKCQTLLFSATMTRSLESIEEIAGAGHGRLPLKKFVIHADNERNDDGPGLSKRQKLVHGESGSGSENDSERDSDDDDTDTKQSGENSDEGNSESEDDELGDSNPCENAGDGSFKSTNSPEEEDQKHGEASEENLTPRIPTGLKQEYIFMPSRVRDAYLLTTIRTLLTNGGRVKDVKGRHAWRGKAREEDDDSDHEEAGKARSTIVFVATCERAALVSGILSQVGVDNVALHSLLSQNRRLAALAKFKSQQVRVLVATDVASRGLDVPSVDLVINSELPRNPVSYVHRIGRTARAGRRGRAISLVSETDVSLVHAAEKITGRPLEKCLEVTDEAAIRMLGPVTKASRLAKMKLMDIGFDELVKKFKERKVRDRKERQRIERALRKQAKKQIESK
jgi:superfamily II DNA/RNA helicase